MYGTNSKEVENNLLKLNNRDRELYNQAKAFEMLYEKRCSTDQIEKLYLATALAEQLGSPRLLESTLKGLTDLVKRSL